MKSNRAARKRFRKTGGSKIKRASAFKRHLLTSKSPKAKRQLRKGRYVSPANTRAVERLLPY